MSSATYTTVSGDTWDVIALRAIGAERWMYLMLEANPAYNYVCRFDAGVALVVPPFPSPPLPVSLPPWRQP